MPKRDDIKSILIIGAGPIVIGQACEFDYSGTQAARALKEEGYKIILVNTNPATIMTDPEIADRTYIEPITVDFVSKIISKDNPNAILPTVGGQTALNLAIELNDNGILDKYNVELEIIDIQDPEQALMDQEDIQMSMPSHIKKAQDDGLKLEKITLQELWDRVKDTNIPGHTALYTSEGRGLGLDYIEIYLNTLIILKLLRK